MLSKELKIINILLMSLCTHSFLISGISASSIFDLRSFNNLTVELTVSSSICLIQLANIYNVPDKDDFIGTSTIGSSEAIMLGLLAHKWNWRQKRLKDNNCTFSSVPSKR